MMRKLYMMMMMVSYGSSMLLFWDIFLITSNNSVSFPVKSSLVIFAKYDFIVDSMASYSSFKAFFWTFQFIARTMCVFFLRTFNLFLLAYAVTLNTQHFYNPKINFSSDIFIVLPCFPLLGDMLGGAEGDFF